MATGKFGPHRSGPLMRSNMRSSLFQRLIGRVNVRFFLHSIADRKALSARHSGPQDAAPQPTAMRASEYLEICEENAIDAYTVEDALYWHNEIITEISIELNLVQATTWPEPVKATMTAALEERLSDHASAVQRLAAVLEKNEQVVWQP
jgi:hypothetical protein